VTSKESYVPDATFSSLVLTLSSSAWVGLGKIADPVTGELKKDLKGAKFTIDILIMLREKTEGNLGEEEEKLLQAVLGDLQANYAETVFSEKETSEQPAPEGSPEGAVTAEAHSKTEPEGGEKAEKSKGPGSTSDIKAESMGEESHKNKEPDEKKHSRTKGGKNTHEEG